MLMYDVIHIRNKARKTGYETYSEGEALVFFEWEAWRDLYLTVNGRLRRKIWDRRPQQLFFSGARSFLPVNYHHFGQTLHNLNQAGFRVQKAINQSLYNLWIPAALRRWAPFAGGSVLSFQDAFQKKHSYMLYSFLGAEFELSLNHNVIGKAGGSAGYVWRQGAKKPQFAWGIYTSIELF